MKDLRDSDNVKRVIESTMSIAREIMGPAFERRLGSLQFKQEYEKGSTVWRWKANGGNKGILQRIEPDTFSVKFWHDQGGGKELLHPNSLENPYEKYPAKKPYSRF